MQKLTLFALAGGALVLSGMLPCTSALAGGTLTVVNRNSSRAIQQVWFANAGESDPWQEANVEEAIRPQSESTFTMSGENCLFDIKVRFSDGYEATFNNVNVCRGDRVLAD
jgi:hypothetical protein